MILLAHRLDTVMQAVVNILQTDRFHFDIY
ncbi:hypothetical protein DFP98_103119 [Cohnella phaseoli]|uniref:Uncharacterized protein n=1 Tax=Cohnella phaseoli TaxID=456490 RepID=A0A3D9KK60_9BACL|nr:hypothetical protein DFP98_103119 [Cohnella phaseoli]